MVRVVSLYQFEILLSNHDRTDRFIGSSVSGVLRLMHDAPSVVRTWVCCDASCESLSVRDTVV